MLRIKQKKESESVNKKKLGDELNAVGVVKLELENIIDNINKLEEKRESLSKEIIDRETVLEIREGEVISINEEVEELRRKRKNANAKNEVSQKNVVEVTLKVSEIRAELARLIEEIKVNEKINLGISKEIEKGKKVKFEVSKISRELEHNSKYVKLQIEENKAQKLRQLSQIENQNKFILEIQEQIKQNMKKAEDEIKGKKGELIFLREELKHTDRQNKEKKTEMWKCDVHIKEEEERIEEEKKELAKRISTFENAKQELKKKWLVLQKGEEIEEVKEFFK